MQMRFYNEAIRSWKSCMRPFQCENTLIVQEANNNYNAQDAHKSP